MERVRLDRAWVLHRRDFRDSSQIVECLTEHHGRVSLVAKGIKRPKHRHRGLLQPFSGLRLSWSSRGELGTLTDVEGDVANTVRLTGDALLAGFYVSELCLKLTHRHDPNPELFVLYGHVITKLASADPVDLTLRRFENHLLTDLGFGINWDMDIDSGRRVLAERMYEMIPDAGPREVSSELQGERTVAGHHLLRIAEDDWENRETRKIGRFILARALEQQLEGKPLQTRRVLRELRHHTQSSGQNDKGDG
ncbi:MAG: DNA repair protein RecO [Pseudomonadota bacterium]